MITTQLKEILDDVKASSAAEVERQVKTEIADKRLVSSSRLSASRERSMHWPLMLSLAAAAVAPRQPPPLLAICGI